MPEKRLAQLVSSTQKLALTLETSHPPTEASSSPKAWYHFSLLFVWDSLASPSGPDPNASNFYDTLQPVTCSSGISLSPCIPTF